VTKSDTKEVSALEAVARHEQDLKARLAEAEQQAQCILTTARAEAAARLEEDEQRLAEELAQIRADAEARCEAESRDVQQACDERLERLRASSFRHAGDIITEVVDLVLPPLPDKGRAMKGRESAP